MSHATVVHETAVIRGRDLLPLPLIQAHIPLVLKGHDLIYELFHALFARVAPSLLHVCTLYSRIGSTVNC